MSGARSPYDGYDDGAISLPSIWALGRATVLALAMRSITCLGYQGMHDNQLDRSLLLMRSGVAIELEVLGLQSC